VGRWDERVDYDQEGDSVERIDRITQADYEPRMSGNQARFLPAASVVVAAFSFMLTTVVWRLVHQTSAVEVAVQQSIVGINRFSAANSAELSRLHQELAGQVAATGALESRLARLESSGVTSLDRIQSLASDMARQWAVTDQVRHELTCAVAGVSQTRQEILERLAVQSDRNATARELMIRDVNAVITQMEKTLLAQAEDFHQQKQQLDVAAERDRATRRVMLSEATQAFSVQVEGLRQILDGLRVEAGVVDGVHPSGAVEAANVSTGEPVPSVPSAEPATAARTKEAVLE
jgi:uncharacterized coiled-coil protein SlyX